MNEEKNNEFEAENEEAVSQETAAEEIVSEPETAEKTENIAETPEAGSEPEEVTELKLEDTDKEFCEDQNEECDETTVPKKRLNKGVIAPIAALAAAAVVLGGFYAVKIFKEKAAVEKYNNQYPDVYGITVGEFADMNGLEFEELVDYYDLPEDMKPEVHFYSAMQNIPISTYMKKVRGISYENAKEVYGWEDDKSINKDTTCGEAMDKVKLSDYFGVDYVDQAKEYYGLDDKVNGDTLYGEVRGQIEKSQIKMREEQEKAEEEAKKQAEEAAKKKEDEAKATEDSAKKDDKESKESKKSDESSDTAAESETETATEKTSEDKK